MKKIICMMLACVMALSLTACGGKNGESCKGLPISKMYVKFCENLESC